MIEIRKSKARGSAQTDWLKSQHTFSFADYYDANFMGAGVLRVINEDHIEAGKGFGMHSHQDMEIITYVISGQLAHKDSMGTGSIILPGEIQKMSAGSGVKHSEFNASATENLHLLQIWIYPDKKNLAPNYEQKQIAKAQDKLILIGCKSGNASAVSIHQDVNLYVGYFTKKSKINYIVQKNRMLWIQMIKGTLLLNEQHLTKGDGAKVQDVDTLEMHCEDEAEFLVFDMLRN